MKFFTTILVFLAAAVHGKKEVCGIIPTNNCVTFTVTQGTGCEWMCSYCANQLGTNNYYFTDNVCTYQEGTGCVGNPYSGKQYTCCASS